MKVRFGPLSIILLLALVSTGSAQMFESFEYGVPPPGWTKINLLGGSGWYQLPIGVMPLPGWGNGTSGVPPTAGAGTHSAYCSWTTGGGASEGYHSDQWLISPQLQGLTATSKLSFWVKVDFTNFPDSLLVRISTSGPNPPSFTYLALSNYYAKGDHVGQFRPWSNYVVNLGSLGIPAGTPIHIAFQEWCWDNTWNEGAMQLDVISSDLTAPPQPRVSPTSLVFTAYYEGSNPSDQTFSMQSIGSSGMGYSRNLVFGAGSTNWLTMGGPSSGALAFQNSQTFTATVSVAGLDLATYTATNVIAVPGATNSPLRVPITLNVIRRPQAIAFPNPGPQCVTNHVGLAGTASSGLPVTFSVFSGPGSVTGATNLSFTGTGVVRVIAWQLGNIYYDMAPCVTNSITVTRAVPVIYLTDLNQTYDGTSKPVTVTTAPTGLPVTVTYNGGSDAPVNAGSYTVNAVVDTTLYYGSSNRTLVIAKATQTVNFAQIPDQETTNRVGLAATASTGLPVTFSIGSGPGVIAGVTNLSFTGAGAVSVVASQAGDTNWAPTAVTNWLTVTKAAASVFLDSLNHVYDGSAHAATATTEPPGLSVDFTYNGSASAPSGAGSYAVTGTVNDAMYQGSAVDTLIVAKADQAITFPAIQPQLTNAVVALGASAALPVTEFAVVSGPGAVNGTNLAFTGAGDVLIRASQSGDENWNPAAPVTNLVKAFSVNPLSGPAAGGNTVTIFNGQLGGVTNVTLCGVAATILDQGTNWVSVTCGAGTPDTGDLVIQSDTDIVVSNAYTVNPAGFIWDSSGGSWTEVAGLPARRANLEAATLHGRIYAIGGNDPDWSVQTNVYAFDGTNWTEVAGLPQPMGWMAAITFDSAIYVMGHYYPTNVYRFDGTNWTEVAGLPENRHYWAGAVMLEKMYLTGGFGLSGGSRTNVFEYDGAQWFEGTGLPEGRVFHENKALGSNLYTIGGSIDGFNMVTNVCRFNGTSWINVAGLPDSRGDMASAVLDNDVYVIAGDQTYFIPQTNVYRYDGSRWIEVVGLPKPSSTLAASTLGKNIYAIGGVQFGVEVFTNVYQFTPAPIGVYPQVGSHAGGYQVTIWGVYLGDGNDVTNVTLCGVPAAVVSQSPTQIVVTAGAGSPGTGAVRVCSVSFGETVKSNAFAYVIPEMSLLGTNKDIIVSGEAADVSKGTDFGNQLVLGTYTNWFAITNGGESALTILGVTTNDSGFFVASGVPSSVARRSSATFAIVYAPSAVGAHSAAITLLNDSTNTPFVINLAGTAIKRDQDALIFTPASPQAYNTTNTLVTSGGSGTGAVSYAVQDGPGEIVGDDGLKMLAGTGTVTVIATKASDSIYNAYMTASFVTAAKAEQPAITFTPDSPQTYLTTNTLAATGGAGTGAFTYEIVSGPGEVVNTDALRLTSGTGTVLVRATKEGDADWLPASVTGSVAAAKADQSISFPAIADQLITNNVGLAATASSGLSVSFGVIGGPAVLSGGTNLGFTGTGVVSVTASQAGDTNWSAAPDVVRIFSVYPLPPNLTTPFHTNAEASIAGMGATIENVFGANATTRGLVWSTTPGFDPATASNASEIGVFGEGAWTQQVAGLVSGLTNYYRAYAVNTAGTGYTAEAWVQMIPEAPVADAATSILLVSFQANWQAARGATNYLLDVSGDPAFSTFVPGYSNRVLGDVRSCSVTGLVSDAAYHCRLRAENQAGVSTNSLAVSTRTKLCLTVLTWPRDAGQTSPEQGTHAVSSGEPMQVATWANAGYNFAYWEGTGSVLVGDSLAPTTTVTVFSNSVLTAYYRQQVGPVSWTYTTWVTNYALVAFVGTAQVCNNSTNGARLKGPFWYCVQNNPVRRLRYPTGTDAVSGWPYLDVTAQIETGLSDDILDPGECVTVTNIAFYMFTYRAPTNIVWQLRAVEIPAEERVDTDGDLMPDGYEALYGPFLDPLNPLDGEEDADQDFMANASEWISGTDPTNDASFFCVDEVRRLDGVGNRVEWPSASNRVYRVFGATNLLNNYLLLQDNVPATPPLNVITDSVFGANVQGYYRIDVKDR